MKRILFISIIIITSIAIQAQDIDRISSIPNEKNNRKEVTLTQNNGKMVAEYDELDVLYKKTLYLWSSFHKNWQPYQKYEYSQNDNNSTMTIIFTKWDAISEAWEKDSKTLNYKIDYQSILSLQ